MTINSADGTSGPGARRPDLRLGVNLIGDLDVNTSIGEVARLLLYALQACNIEVSYVELDAGRAHFGTVDDNQAAGLPRGLKYPINLLVYHFVDLGGMTFDCWRDVVGIAYTIAYWFWELPEVPERFWPQFARVDEIWVSSNHVRDILMPRALGPVYKIPLPINVKAPATIDRKSFGIPENRFVFLSSFARDDMRKNPWATIQSFKCAFGDPTPDGPLLVIKTQSLAYVPWLRPALQSAVSSVGGLFIESDLSRDEMINLLACADAYISLHRAEGFGISIVEAMALGKPTILTDYSANTDYATTENSFLVRYSLCHINQTKTGLRPEFLKAYGSSPGQVWAEADVDDAADKMRFVVENVLDAARKGERAAHDIRAYCGMEVINQQLHDRLLAINTHLALVSNNSDNEDPLATLLEMLQIEHGTLIRQLNEMNPKVPAWSHKVPGMAKLIRMGYRLRTLGKRLSLQQKLSMTLAKELEIIVRYNMTRTLD